jgi:predicted tellurium resistance membrane protein TerC
MVFDIAALVQVILIDLALAGDNASAVGLAAAALPQAQQRRVIALGVALALLLRIVFALVGDSTTTNVFPPEPVATLARLLDFSALPDLPDAFGFAATFAFA